MQFKFDDKKKPAIIREEVDTLNEVIESAEIEIDKLIGGIEKLYAVREALIASLPKEDADQLELDLDDVN